MKLDLNLCFFFLEKGYCSKWGWNPDCLHRNWMHFNSPGLHHGASVPQAALQDALSPLSHLSPEHGWLYSLQNGNRGSRGEQTAPAPAYSGVLTVNVLMGDHLLTAVGIPLQHVPHLMLEMGNQPKDNLCF